MITIENNRLRKILRVLLPVVVIPATVLLGGMVFDEKRHLLVSFLVALFTVLFFLTGFEKKRVGARRVVILSVMVALCVVGRFIPFFKPVTAITMLSAIYLGSEAGFATGAFAALLSNFYFGQGPWTPFQMLAWGLIGLIAGLLSKPLQKSRVLLLICGAVSGILFSMVMDVWNLLWTYNTLDLRLYGGVLLTALPHTVLYTVSNLVFLWLMAKPFGEKLNRIKIKYGV